MLRRDSVAHDESLARLQQQLADERRAHEADVAQRENALASLRQSLSTTEEPALRARIEELEALLKHARTDNQTKLGDWAALQQQVAEKERAVVDKHGRVLALEKERDEVRLRWILFVVRVRLSVCVSLLCVYVPRVSRGG